MPSAPSVPRSSRPGFARVFVVLALLCLILLDCPERCLAQPAVPDEAQATYHTPILALWRDPGSFLVIQTAYGNFYYPFDTPVPAGDGRGRLRLSDPGNGLLRAIFQSADGMPVTLRVNLALGGMLVGLNGARASFEPVSDAAPNIP